MKKNTREEQIVNAISTDGFEYKGVFYRAMNTRTLMLLEKYKSPFFYGGDQLKGLMDFLYITSHDPKEVARISIDDWDDVILDYSETLSPSDLKELGELARSSNEENASTMVEVREESAKK